MNHPGTQTSCLVTAARLGYELTGCEPFDGWEQVETIDPTDTTIATIVTIGSEEEGVPGEEHQLVIVQRTIVDSFFQRYEPTQRPLPDHVDWIKIAQFDVDEWTKLVPSAKFHWGTPITRADMRVCFFQRKLCIEGNVEFI